MILGIEHTAICSPNPKALADWYTSTLGFTVSYQSSSTLMVKAQNGFMVEITAAEGGRPPDGMKLPGIRHMAIAVDEFDAVLSNLREKGVKVLGEPIDNKGNKVIFFRDPEGNLLHLLQRSQPLA
jgi:catechol-2,3-dioxygenase